MLESVTLYHHILKQVRMVEVVKQVFHSSQKVGEGIKQVLEEYLQYSLMYMA